MSHREDDLMVFIRKSCCPLESESSCNLTAVKDLLMSVCRDFCQGIPETLVTGPRTHEGHCFGCLFTVGFADSDDATFLPGIVLFLVVLT